MLLFEWIVPLLVGAVALTMLARRIGAPYPAFLALGGVVLAVLPQGPNFRLDPDLALALFVAPILLDTAYDASVRDLRAQWLPIALMALGAVGVTTAAVAVTAKLLQPDLPWAAAIVLGAIVAPPDATAATAILRQVRLPYRIRVILEGESLLNDASALFIYRLALGAVVAGAVRPAALASAFILVLPASLLFGWVLTKVTTRIVENIQDVPSSIIIQFTFTFGVWMLAERLQLSPVLTLFAYAVVISERPQPRLGARLRLPAFAVWEAATFTLNVLAFVLIGLQLRPILEAMPREKLASAFVFALAVFGVCVLARLVWVMAARFLRINSLLRIRRGARPEAAMSVGENVKRSFVIGWCGMRGIVTLAAAFALPDGSFGTTPFPHRELMLLTAFTVVLGTLVLQGLTLRPILQLFGFADDDMVAREIGRARRQVNEAALAEIGDADGLEAHILRKEYSEILRQAEAHPDGYAPASTKQDELRRRTVAAARTRLFALRASGEIGNDAFQVIEFELDRAEMHATEV